ncbi:hypothetical protein HPP92_009084 [Vanilla planifolia]|uniref:Uncharacterized protein n=1 Tax=Vanilla planifolia TaxID=51239 RepID=A0A835V5Z5_VANPL|nr:hypothetical protein HPP92_009084 [Vanilla planifolia]
MEAAVGVEVALLKPSGDRKPDNACPTPQVHLLSCSLFIEAIISSTTTNCGTARLGNANGDIGGESDGGDAGIGTNVEVGDDDIPFDK